MAFKASNDSGTKARPRLTREALINLRLNENGESTQYISLYSQTIDSSSDSTKLRRNDDARILALDLQQAMTIDQTSSSVSSTEASRRRAIRVREKYNQLAPMATRIPQYVRPRTETTPEHSQTSQVTSTSQRSEGVRYYKYPPPPGRKGAEPAQSFDDSTWRHSAEFRRLKDEALETAKLKTETRDLFGMNAFSDEPEVDWDREDAIRSSEDDLPTAIPDVFPPYRVVDSAAELGNYLASSSYVVSLGGPPLPEIKYGIIIVPANEERLLFSGYGDHAAMPTDVKDQIYSKSKAFQREHERQLRQQAADEVAQELESQPEELDENDKDFYKKRWLIRTGRPTTTTKKVENTEVYQRTWLIHTGRAVSANNDKREPSRQEKPPRVMSAPLPQRANQLSPESESETEAPNFQLPKLPSQSSQPDTADYDDKTEEDYAPSPRLEPRPEPELEAKLEPFVPKVKIYSIPQSQPNKVEHQKKQLAHKEAPISSETDDREWFRDYYDKKVSRDRGMTRTPEDIEQFELRRRRVLERRGVACSNSQPEHDAVKNDAPKNNVPSNDTPKAVKPEPVQEIAPAPVPEQKEQIVAEKAPSVESSGSQTSGSESSAGSTVTDATSNPNPTDTNLPVIEKPSVQVQSKPPVSRAPANEPVNKSIKGKACATIKRVFTTEKWPAKNHNLNSVLPGPRVKSPLPRLQAHNRGPKLDVARVITSLTNGDPNAHAEIAAQVGLSFKPTRTLSRVH